MSFLGATRSVERQRFFDGQRLFADDLQAIEAFNREMRWLHNQSLHQPGIGNGFAVSGKKGDRNVVVGPGYAIDDLGREIVLTSSRTIPVQPVAGDGEGNAQRYLLTVQYPADDDLEEVEFRQGICADGGATRLREEPIFCWVKLNPDGTPAEDQQQILTGRMLVLAEVAVRDCKLDRDVSIVQRRNARPPAQPYIACGSEAPNPWEIWDVGAGSGDDSENAMVARALSTQFQIIGGVQSPIDTSQAGFQITPGYFGRIDGPRVITLSLASTSVRVIIDGLLNIADQTAAGFTAQVLVLLLATYRIDEGVELVRRVREQPEGEAPRFVEGFDISALPTAIMRPLLTLRSDVEHAAAAIETPELGLAATPTTPEELLLELTRDWSVGWMGVEG